MIDRASIQSGMPVRGAHGERLGRVVACGPRHFIVRRSAWTRRHRAIAYPQVTGLRRGMVWLRGGREALLPESAASDEGPLMTVLPLDPSSASIEQAVRSVAEP